jgi:hypothetical protein
VIHGKTDFTMDRRPRWKCETQLVGAPLYRAAMVRA